MSGDYRHVSMVRRNSNYSLLWKTSYCICHLSLSVKSKGPVEHLPHVLFAEMFNGVFGIIVSTSLGPTVNRY